MVASLTFRTADNTRWGGGQGSDLAAVAIDLNFWTLFSAVQALEDHSTVNAGIDYINQPAGGNTFFIHLTNHAVLGPFIIPTAQWSPRGEWQPDTTYAAYDLVGENGALYLITIPHTSGTTFSPFATDGQGHDLYVLVLEQPADQLPVGGTPGQRLVKSTSSPYTTEWLDDLIRLHVFVEGQPLPSEILIQYTVVDNMTLPIGLAGSVFYQDTEAANDTVYAVIKNGASIGSVTFAADGTINVAFAAVITCVPGDVIQLQAPSSPDSEQANISFTLVATLTL